MTREYVMENWSVTGGCDPYTPPECQRIHISGVCPARRRELGSPKEKLDKPITSAYIVKVEGRKVTTASGGVYTLGTIDPGYEEYLKTLGRTYDYENPIRIRS